MSDVDGWGLAGFCFAMRFGALRAFGAAARALFPRFPGRTFIFSFILFFTSLLAVLPITRSVGTTAARRWRLTVFLVPPEVLLLPLIEMRGACGAGDVGGAARPRRAHLRLVRGSCHTAAALARSPWQLQGTLRAGQVQVSLRGEAWGRQSVP